MARDEKRQLKMTIMPKNTLFKNLSIVLNTEMFNSNFLFEILKADSFFAISTIFRLKMYLKILKELPKTKNKNIYKLK